ncbi:phage minor head protein [Bacillus velezensis]|uniref:phage minor head protein n=1 Tax=Bacillus velezensis TaxID=492670 RepID=UPI000F8E4107|nr:phage minor head protein [Bacillus velezensis]RUS07881.1 hypothetical protein EFW58_00629 [Bacillus velezensis]
MDKEQTEKELLKPLTRKMQEFLRKLKRLFRGASEKILSKLTALFVKLDKGREISLADANRSNDLSQIKKDIASLITALSAKVKTAVLDFLTETYESSYNWLMLGILSAVGFKLSRSSKGKLPVAWAAPASISQTITSENMLKAIETDRKKTVQKINHTIERGFIERKRFVQVAKELQADVGVSYNRAQRIVRTEMHRVREKATLDAATKADSNGIAMKKIWHNMGDERVREGRNADHVHLEGQARFVNELFDLGQDKNGKSVRAPAPGQSGDPSNDINCRCFATYEPVL